MFFLISSSESPFGICPRSQQWSSKKLIEHEMYVSVKHHTKYFCIEYKFLQIFDASSCWESRVLSNAKVQSGSVHHDADCAMRTNGRL